MWVLTDKPFYLLQNVFIASPMLHASPYRKTFSIPYKPFLQPRHCFMWLLTDKRFAILNNYQNLADLANPIKQKLLPNGKPDTEVISVPTRRFPEVTSVRRDRYGSDFCICQALPRSYFRTEGQIWKWLLYLQGASQKLLPYGGTDMEVTSVSARHFP